MLRRDFSWRLAGIGFGLALTGAARAQGAPVEGQHYVRLSPPVAVTLSAPDKKVDLIEFFWYGCPHCYAFEPLLDRWTRTLAADVGFRRVPVGFAAAHQIHQRVYYALEEMDLLASHHRRFFDAIHRQNLRLQTAPDITAWMAANGVDGARFETVFKSFSVNAKATKARQLAEDYKIDGVPALGINGRYYTAASLAGSHEKALAVADFLIQLSRQKP
jgi:thiol:disulfide interchange protein DsbA